MTIQNTTTPTIPAKAVANLYSFFMFSFSVIINLALNCVSYYTKIHNPNIFPKTVPFVLVLNNNNPDNYILHTFSQN